MATTSDNAFLGPMLKQTSPEAYQAWLNAGGAAASPSLVSGGGSTYSDPPGSAANPIQTFGDPGTTSPTYPGNTGINGTGGVNSTTPAQTTQSTGLPIGSASYYDANGNYVGPTPAQMGVNSQTLSASGLNTTSYAVKLLQSNQDPSYVESQINSTYPGAQAKWYPDSQVLAFPTYYIAKDPNTPGGWNVVQRSPEGGNAGNGSGFSAGVVAPPASSGGLPWSSQASDLYKLLLGRAQQSLNVSPDDPLIKNQVSAFNATQDKAAREYIDKTAESAGPMANIGSEKRLAAETVGQNTSGFQATAIVNELTARRNEIQQALTGAQGLLTAEQSLGLQKQLADMNQALAYAQLQQNNNQFNANLGQNAYQFDITDEFRRSPLASAA